MKFSIGIVVAIVLQVSAFVWWTAQQAQTIQTLEGQVKELTAKSEIEKEVTLKNDVKQLRKELDELKENTLESILEIDNMRVSEDTRLGAHIDERIEGLGSYVDERLLDITNNIIAEFQKHVFQLTNIDTFFAYLAGYTLDVRAQLQKNISKTIFSMSLLKCKVCSRSTKGHNFDSKHCNINLYKF